MNTRVLALLAVVAKAGSITEAANKLLISQPAVSMQLRRLEEEVGVSLFATHGRGIMLTEAGKTFLEHALSMLAMEEQLTRAMEEYREGKRGHIVLGADPAIGTYALPPFMASFLRDHEGIRLELCLCPGRELEKRVKAGEIDVGITASDCVDHLYFRVTECFSDSLVVVTSAQPLSDEVYVGLDMRDTMDAYSLGSAIEVETTELAKQFVLSGLGKAIVWRSAVERELVTGSLQLAAAERMPLEVTLCAVTRPAERLSKSVWLLLNHLASIKSLGFTGLSHEKG